MRSDTGGDACKAEGGTARIERGIFQNEEAMQPGGSVDLKLSLPLYHFFAMGRDGIERY